MLLVGSTLPGDQPGRGAEDVGRGVGVPEIEEGVQAAGQRIERARNALATQPVVFYEAQNRGLVGNRVVDVVLLGVGRDHQQRKTRTISAAALGMLDGDTRKGGFSATAQAGTGKGIHGGGRLVDDGTHLVVIPAVGVVIGNHYSGICPVFLLLQKIDNGDDECLLVEGIGVAGVAVLIARRLEEADSGGGR